MGSEVVYAVALETPSRVAFEWSDLLSNLLDAFDFVAVDAVAFPGVQALGNVDIEPEDSVSIFSVEAFDLDVGEGVAGDIVEVGH